jgi:hypothetical protein
MTGGFAKPRIVMTRFSEDKTVFAGFDVARLEKEKKRQALLSFLHPARCCPQGNIRLDLT